MTKTMLVLAFLLDLWIGDPVYPFHPIRLMGRAIERAENFLRRLIPHEKVAGTALALFFPLLVFTFVWSLLFFLEKVHPWLAWFANLFGIYSALSIHDLKKEGLQIYKDLKQNDLEKAKRNLTRIVGRDTSSLDQNEVLQATIETIAESTLDGVIAPLFYAAIGGAPLALAYKAVNTLDSMIGHLNERYRHFGYVAAKQDELWNWIPAKLSYFAVVFATPFVKMRFKEALSVGWHYGMAQDYGNGSIPEAAFAGALGLRLGGTNFYEGRAVDKPFLGLGRKKFEIEDLSASLRLMVMASWMALCGSLVINSLAKGVYLW